MFARLRQYLDGHVVGDEIVLYQMTHEIEFDFRGGREADLYLLEADVEEEPEHFQFLLQVHRRDQRLIAVTQVDRAPARRMPDGRVRPRTVFEPDGREGAVFF